MSTQRKAKPYVPVMDEQTELSSRTLREWQDDTSDLLTQRPQPSAATQLCRAARHIAESNKEWASRWASLPHSEQEETPYGPHMPTRVRDGCLSGRNAALTSSLRCRLRCAIPASYLCMYVKQDCCTPCLTA